MKNLNIFFILLILAFSLCLSAPTYAQSTQKANSSASESQKSTSAPVGESSKTKDALAKKPYSDENGINKDKEDWLKRAKESKLLTGKASWYGSDFHNKKTASGLSYDMYTFTAAHRTLPLGTVVKVTDQHNGKSVMVCITDRGPYVQGRIIDLSYAAAKKLDLEDRGVGKVALEVISDERGTPLKSGQAYYIKYISNHKNKRIGPYDSYADAAAMHEAIRQAHPEAEVVMENANK